MSMHNSTDPGNGNCLTLTTDFAKLFFSNLEIG